MNYRMCSTVRWNLLLMLVCLSSHCLNMNEWMNQSDTVFSHVVVFFIFYADFRLLIHRLLRKAVPWRNEWEKNSFVCGLKWNMNLVSSAWAGSIIYAWGKLNEFFSSFAEAHWSTLMKRFQLFETFIELSWSLSCLPIVDRYFAHSTTFKATSTDAKNISKMWIFVFSFKTIKCRRTIVKYSCYNCSYFDRSQRRKKTQTFTFLVVQKNRFLT